uniref:RWD domain-containing protein n=1 Tax=Odontella aurita TaxID=265563 RepID=A0A7S4I7L3_9STRA|mmetsp:Transcript_20880/g.60781  ORF Transcript_20880/g.60781 Transcript_20880/m.60781 type:complete len:310 (+) Transcript_20880:240-1169(+)
MSDHVEEQEMEAEALEAIFDVSFSVVHDAQPFVWSVRLVPVDCGGDESEELEHNHVAVKLVATIPPTYPEDCGPELDVEIERGLAEQHREEILGVARDEADANEGMPAIFAVCEAVRGWLADNNEKGLEDVSMHAQMMRKKKDEERSKAKQEQKFESQKKAEEMTEAELEEIAVRKRRADGTPCTEENFLAWKEQFDKEMEEEAAREVAEREREGGSNKKKGAATEIKSRRDAEREGRPTGYELFSGKAGTMNLEALEAAAEEAEEGSDEDDAVTVEDLDVDENLFDDDDDLDDLDFDDDDCDEEEPEI